LKFLLDTNIVSESVRKIPRAEIAAWLVQHQLQCALSTVTVAEICYGASRLPVSNRRRLIEEYLETLCQDLKILPYDLPASLWLGKEKARLEREGTPVDLADSMIAAVAVTRELILVTENERHFKNFQGLTVYNPARG